jgi:hypothetical protein
MMESLHYLGTESVAHMEMGHMDLYKLEVLELEQVLKESGGKYIRKTNI